jgi:thiol-disulfide isomerase/thioredoxin
MSVSMKAKGSADSGPPVGSILPELPAGLQDALNPSGASNQGGTVSMFISMHCTFCIDLLPHIASMMQEHPSLSFRLFSTGDEEDHQSMTEYFGWDFPIVHMDQSDMEAYLSVTYLPFMILTDDKGTVASKGVVYNDADFRLLVKGCSRNEIA